jgi:hypothetical protein
MYYWDGQQWVSTLSHDGRTRWNGSAWVPAGQMSGPPMYQQPQVTRREPTSWTRPLQYAVAGFYALQALYSLTLPFWMSGPVSQAMTQSMERQQQLNPRGSPPPAEVASMMTSMMSVALWIAAVGALAISVVVIIGALKRWTWMYYVVLVFLGLSTISAPLNLISAATGSSMNAAPGFSLPTWTYAVGAIVAIPTAALFVWMLVALVKRGPWGMTRVAPS